MLFGKEMEKVRIDKEKWERKEIFDFFSAASAPFYMVTFKQDITKLYRYVKERGISFYYALVYLCSEAINSIEAFSYTTENGEIYKLDRRIPSFTDLKKGKETFHIVTMDCSGGIDAFCRRAAEKSASQKEFIRFDDEGEELIYFSCAPWFEMTALTNEKYLDGDGAADSSIPHIAWGKYADDGERKVLHISVEVNHRFIDGIHIGKFHRKLTGLIDSLQLN